MKVRATVAPGCAIVLLLLQLMALPSQVQGQEPAPAATPANTEAPPAPKKGDMRVYRTIMDPKNVADVFGNRIAKRYVVIQVTISNQNPDFDWIIHDLSLDVSKIYTDKGLQKLAVAGRPPNETSSEELSIVRGVAEKGQYQDPRNRILRFLRAAGTIAGGITGVTTFGSSFAPSVAAFNGPVLTAYAETFPDYTINQLVRLQDRAYITNTVVPKQQAKVVVVFLPQAMFMTRDQRKAFWKEPVSVFQEIDFRKLEVILDGNFITKVQEGPS